MSRSRQEPTQERSAGGVVFRLQDGRPQFLLIRDSYRNWGFPKGHIEDGEPPADAAMREVGEETGLASLAMRGELGEIDWHFRFRGRLIHKRCAFFLLETTERNTTPQREEGITACRWVALDDALSLVSYANAREMLVRAAELLNEAASRR